MMKFFLAVIQRFSFRPSGCNFPVHQSLTSKKEEKKKKKKKRKTRKKNTLPLVHTLTFEFQETITFTLLANFYIPPSSISHWSLIMYSSRIAEGDSQQRVRPRWSD